MKNVDVVVYIELLKISSSKINQCLLEISDFMCLFCEERWVFGVVLKKLKKVVVCAP